MKNAATRPIVVPTPTALTNQNHAMKSIISVYLSEFDDFTLGETDGAHHCLDAADNLAFG